MDPLTSEIYQILLARDRHKCLGENLKLRMANELAAFVEVSIEKFMRGQKEHGGKITDKDLNIEIFHELIDLFWYTRAQHWKDI